MFNLGFGELAVILVILLLVVGPTRLPTLMKSTGKAIRTLRQASRDIRTSVGFDEMMREDLLQPTPPRRIPAPRPAVDSQPRGAVAAAIAASANAPVAPSAPVAPVAAGAAPSATAAATPTVSPDADTPAPGGRTTG